MKFIKLLFSSAFIALASKNYAQIINKGDFIIKDIEVTTGDNTLFNETNANFYNNGKFYLFRDLTNSGLFHYVTKGDTYFIGSNPQNISTDQTTGHTNFYNLNINNNSGADIMVFNEFFIDNKSKFVQGIVNNNSPIIYEANASSENQNDASYIKGVVRKKGSNYFGFPLGANSIPYSNTLYYVGTSSTNVIDVKYNLASTLTYDHDNREFDVKAINEKEYFEIKSFTPNTNASLELNYNPLYISDNVIQPIFGTVIGIVCYDFALNKWVSKGGALDSNKVSNPNTNITDGIYTIGRIYSEAKALEDLIIYNGISKSEDNKNDFLYIQGIENFPNNSLQIFNRYGNIVYQKTGYTNDQGWKGTFEDKVLPSGTYFYILDITTNQSQEQIQKKGFLQLN